MHSVLRPFKCDVCNKRFVIRKELKQHEIIHTEEQTSSNVCSESLNNKSTLNAHQVIHTEEHPFVCDACNKSFKWKNHLIRHISLYCVKRL
jgi:uncharacterized Zn-finger protein